MLVGHGPSDISDQLRHDAEVSAGVSWRQSWQGRETDEVPAASPLTVLGVAWGWMQEVARHG
jgi:hypothetical protein